MSFSIKDFHSDSASIQDVFLCWESSEDDSDLDSIDLIPAFGEVGGNIATVIPVSPRQSNSKSTNFSKDAGGQLDGLMKKYPSFIPESLPAVPRKRTRPICLFVNYMGTSGSVSLQAKSTPPKTKTKGKSKKKQVFKASPYPSDAPMPQVRPAKKARRVTPTALQAVEPVSAQIITPLSTPVTTPTQQSHKLQKISLVSPMPTLGPTIPRTSVTPPPVAH